MRGANIFGIIWVSLMASLGVWLAVMLQDNQLPYDYDVSKSYISPDPAKPNSLITVHWSIKVNRLCPGYTMRSFSDPSTGKIITTYDATPTALNISAGDTVLVRTFMLRGDMPEKVIYHSKSCFRCNPLQQLSPICGPELKLPFEVSQDPKHND